MRRRKYDPGKAIAQKISTGWQLVAEIETKIRKLDEAERVIKNRQFSFVGFVSRAKDPLNINKKKRALLEQKLLKLRQNLDNMKKKQRTLQG
ncbi:MAG: hypothetical protein AAB552_01295 [Patescibacteria group bacterium]|mgnify:CR=1 FL=1